MRFISTADHYGEKIDCRQLTLLGTFALLTVEQLYDLAIAFVSFVSTLLTEDFVIGWSGEKGCSYSMKRLNEEFLRSKEQGRWMNMNFDAWAKGCASNEQKNPVCL